MVETLLFVGVFVILLATKICLLTENLWGGVIMFKMGNFWRCYQSFLEVESRKIQTWTTICIRDSIHGRD